MGKNRLVCRNGFGYVLVAVTPAVQDGGQAEFFVCKTPDRDEMKYKITLAEELFECECEYENFPAEEVLTMKAASGRASE